MKKIATMTFVALSLLLFALTSYAQASGVAATPGAVPRLIKFSGVINPQVAEKTAQVTENEAAKSTATGPIGVTFSLYALQEGGSSLWSESQQVQLDSQRRYSVLLGATMPEGLPLDLFTSGQALWLGVQPQVPGATEQPRVLLVAVPYALKAADADTLGGLPASAFAQIGQAPGNVAAAGAPGLSPAGGASGGGTRNSAGQAQQPKGKTAKGNPTSIADYLPYWNGTNNVGNSAIYQLGTSIGIGTTSPGATLDVNGNFNLPSTTSATVGVINLGGTPFIHECCYVSGGTGYTNTFVGLSAGNFSSTGYANTGIGSGVLTSNTTGTWNTAIGYNAFVKNTTGYDNQAIGSGALLYNTTGHDNTAIGLSALLQNTTGAYNTCVGSGACQYGTTAVGNTMVGYLADFQVTTGGGNTMVGYEAGLLNTKGSDNTASGYQALYSNTTGVYNTASGYEALSGNTSGNDNTAIGYNALYSSTTACCNTATGYAALSSATGGGNTACGHQALVANTTGAANTASGYKALYNNTTGGDNTALGSGTCSNVTSASNVICIGQGVAGANTSNTTYVGGIYGTTLANGTNPEVCVNSAGQLGTGNCSGTKDGEVADLVQQVQTQARQIADLQQQLSQLASLIAKK